MFLYKGQQTKPQAGDVLTLHQENGVPVLKLTRDGELLTCDPDEIPNADLMEEEEDFAQGCGIFARMHALEVASWTTRGLPRDILAKATLGRPATKKS